MGKKGKKDKKKKDDGPTEEEIPEDLKDLTIPQLRERIDGANYRLAKAAKERNYMQLEKDMVNRFYDISRQEVAQIEAEILCKERQMEMMEKDHQVHIRVHEQKVQNLEYEHKNERKDVQNKGNERVQAENEQHASTVKKLNDDKAVIKRDLKEKQLANEQDVNFMIVGFQRNLDKQRETFEGNHAALVAMYEEQVKQLEADLELRRKVEIHEIEERKNQHINELMLNNQEHFDYIKRYYNDITHDNLQLIRSLKDEIQEMRSKEKSNQKKMFQLTIENRQLTEPLAQKEKKRAELEDQLKSYNKDKMALRNLRARTVQLEEKIKDARTDLRGMEDRLAKVEKERDDLYKRFNKQVKDMRRKAEFKNIVLEKTMDVLATNLNEKQAQLGEVLNTARLDATEVKNLSDKLEQVLGSKSRLIKELQYQVHQCTKSYNDTIRVYEAHLTRMGIPGEDIGFEPINTATSTMPASLVTKVA